MLPVLVGLDVGTSASKAAVFDQQGRQLSQARVPLTWSRTPDGTEVDPTAIWSVACQALTGALGDLDDPPVAAVGVTGMAECGVLLDAAGRCLSPVIAWHDERDRHELELLQADLGASAFSATTGLPAWTQWSITKHRWLSTHRPAVRRAAHRLHIPEWIVTKLGGQEASEQSLASRTGWLELAGRRWWDRALAWSDLDPSVLPPLVTAGTPLGVARDGPPGLRGATLTVAGHDHQVAAVGVGAVRVDDEVNSSGTADALVRSTTPDLPTDSVLALTETGITVGWHALGDRWCLLGDSRGGLLLEASSPPPETGAPLVPPVALLKEAAAATAALHQAMAEVVGPPTRIIATGGWSRNVELLSIKRRLMGPMAASPVTEGGCRGAALFAGMAAGLYSGPSDFPLSRRPGPDR